jgi:hypothetical protein
MAEVKYRLIESNKKTIIVREFFGDVEVSDVTESFKYIFKEYAELNIVGIITDLTQANFNIGIKEFPKVLQFILQNKKSFSLKMAVIADTPKKTVFPMLAQVRFKFLPVKPFTTMQAAIDWMKEE